MMGYEGLKTLGLGLKEAYRDILPLNLPIVLVSKHNLGSSLGRILVEDLLVGREPAWLVGRFLLILLSCPYHHF